MSILKVTKPNIPAGETIVSTSWVMAENGDWNNLFFSSMNDKVNLLSIKVDKPINPKTIYKAMVKIVHTGGVTLWSDVDTLVVLDNKLIDSSLHTPSLINKPKLTTGYDLNNHPITGFTVKLSDYEVYGESVLKSASWLIEDKNGDVVMFIPETEENLTEIVIKDKLRPNEIYTIRAAFKGSNNDVSDFGALTIYTSMDSNLQLLTNLNGKAAGDAIELVIVEVDNMTKVEWQLVKDGNNVWTGVSTSTTTIIPATVIEENSEYVLIGRLVINGKEQEYNYYRFSTTDKTVIYLDGPLPFPIGTQGTQG